MTVRDCQGMEEPLRKDIKCDCHMPLGPNAGLMKSCLVVATTPSSHGWVPSQH
jgi:hypothetical protein